MCSGVIIMDLPNRPIVCIDMRSFYASCAAVDEGLDVMTTPIAIIGDKGRKGSVVLAASPPLKKQYGIQTGNRLFEIPKDPTIRLIEAKMDYYLKVSMEITRLLNLYVPKEAIFPYSIDESFIDLSGTDRLWGSPLEVIERIQEDLMRQFELHAAFGMGPNLLLSKLALDLEAKQTGIAIWSYEDVREKLWPVTPLKKMWGIGGRLQKRLNDLGIFSVGDLAHADLRILEKKFGIIGHQLYHHAHGIDLSGMDPFITEDQMSFGKGQILYRDYVKRSDIATLVLEMCEDIGMRLRTSQQQACTIHLSVGYSKQVGGGGFNRAHTVEEATNDTLALYDICMLLLDTFHDGRPVRQITIRTTKLEDERVVQLSLFDQTKWEKRLLNETIDRLRRTYGPTAVLRATSYTEAGTAIHRSKLIGGHYK